MTNNIIRSSTPIEEEIKVKRTTLSKLEAELAEAELDIATYENELSHFKVFYQSRVGPYLIELDEINARIAEAISILSPHSEKFQQRAQAARKRAQKTYEEVSGFNENEIEDKKVKGFAPTNALKQIYREIAKKVHPDLAEDNKDRAHRTLLMQEVNRAYSDQNLDQLESILADLNEFGGSSPSSRHASELKRLDRLILKIRQRIREIVQKKSTLEMSDLGKLKEKYEMANQYDEDIIDQIILELEGKINRKVKLIDSILRVLGEEKHA
jgi:hypothetical protein